MRLEVYARPPKFSAEKLKHSTVIVVDVLRATTSIIWAIKNGAKQVIPAQDANTAFAYASKMGMDDCVLAGERGGVKIEGFTLGNSPESFESRRVWKKTVVISTTNGTNAINTARTAKHLIVGAMINRTAAAIRALEYGNDIIIICAGTDNKDSADDMCAAGAIAEAIGRYSAVNIVPNDMALVCTLLYANWMDGTADLKATFHYARLLRLGFAEDVDFCFRRDMTSIVPEFVNDSIVRVDSPQGRL